MKMVTITPAIVSERYQLWGVTPPKAGWPSNTQPLSQSSRQMVLRTKICICDLLTLTVGQVIHYQIISE